jgi:hypothetical protein
MVKMLGYKSDLIQSRDAHQEKKDFFCQKPEMRTADDANTQRMSV